MSYTHMKKAFLILFIVLVTMLGCSPKTTQNFGSPLNTEIIGTQAIYARKYLYDRARFDNRCKEEKISSDLANWSKVAFKGYEDRQGFYQYYFVVEDPVPGVSEKMYKLDLDLAEEDTTFILEIRTTSKIKQQ